MVEIKDKNYSELDEEKSFTEFCELVVKTTDEDGNTAEEEKEGVQIKGKDVIYLNAPLILPSKDTPLLTKAPDIAGAINELFQGGGEGGDDWQPPDWWIPVLEPQEYEMYFLIYSNTSNNFGVSLTNKERPSNIKAFFDWGDGTTEELEGYAAYRMFTHTYESSGQYLVKVVTNDTSNYLAGFMNTASNGMPIQIAKLGNNTVLSLSSINRAAFGLQYSLNYLVINGDYEKSGFTFQDCRNLKKLDVKTLPTEIAEYAFSGCVNLTNAVFEKVTSNLTVIPAGAFVGCYGLKSITAANCTAVGEQAFISCHCLNDIKLPSCKEIGDKAFMSCYSLNEITVAEGCSFGKDCFQSCYSLYPRPDGSTN